ncbi:MAG TPA: hypothetical protein VE404_04350 [Verrucomicrobiae bacterium]|nr:hypothetical protein [Verrucomicrobiae bacterium]
MMVDRVHALARGTGHASWHFVSGEYPPQPGGVSDYCRLVADSLTEAGEEVHVWAPPSPAMPGGNGRVHVHRISDRFGLRGLRDLTAGIDAFPPPRRIFIQFVSGAFGWRAMNFPFCLWARGRREDHVWVMFHEYAYRTGWNLKPAHNLLGLVTPALSGMLVAAADRVFVSTPAWERRIPARLKHGKPVRWLPVPSNIAADPDPSRVAAARERATQGRAGPLLGHFGTYGPLIAGLVSRVIPPLLAADRSRRFLLMGRGSEEFAAALSQRAPGVGEQISATGGRDPIDIAASLKACDLLIQRYEDGATSRRGSLMAGLRLGVPIVSNLGESSEPLWKESGALALAASPAPESLIAAAEVLIAAPDRWGAMSRQASILYNERFSPRSTTESLLAAARAEEPTG